jgi:hypothetical protein
VDVGIVWRRSQTRGGPTRNSLVLAVSRAGGQKGDGGGECGLLIGVARGQNGRALIRMEGGSNGVVSRRDFRPEVEDEPS